MRPIPSFARTGGARLWRAIKDKMREGLKGEGARRW